MVRARDGADVGLRAITDRAAVVACRRLPLRARARLYNFQGLRAFKDKFNPEWESHYLAYPAGSRLVRMLADVSALIAGGYRRVILPQ